MTSNTIKIQNGEVFTRFDVKYREENGFVDVIIPAYGLTYSATNVETAMNRAKTMVKAFYSYHLEKKGLKNLVLQIHKLGWHSQMHNFTVKQLISGKLHDAKFTQEESESDSAYKSEALELEAIG